MTGRARPDDEEAHRIHQAASASGEGQVNQAGRDLTVTNVFYTDTQTYARLSTADPLAEPAKLLASSCRDPGTFSYENEATISNVRPWAGVEITALTNPFDLGVKRAIHPRDEQPDALILPIYVRRDHDEKLNDVVQQAIQGDSAVAVLVGGPSTGKTRACWEALSQLPHGWKVWHPITPTYARGLIKGIRNEAVGPRTVVWLDDAIQYLAGPRGSEAAAELLSLLGPGRPAPILVLATLRSQHWIELTDDYPVARQLIAGPTIDIPSSFFGSVRPGGGGSGAESATELRQVCSVDRRWYEACRYAQDERYVQYLAGAQLVVDRYTKASPLERALIEVAMDVRRFRCGPYVLWSFLKAAVEGYLSQADSALSEHELKVARDDVSKKLQGLPGPLWRVRDRSGGDERRRYRLDPYLEQFDTRTWRDQPPPQSFWAAAAQHLDAEELNLLANLAAHRHLLLVAAQLWKQAAAQGHSSAALNLFCLLHLLHPEDHIPKQWIAQRIGLDDLGVAMLERLWDLRASAEFDTLADRLVVDPPVGEPHAIAMLLSALLTADRREKIDTLLEHDLGGRVSLARLRVHSAYALLKVPTYGELVTALREVGATDQSDTLVHRLASDVAIDDSALVAAALEVLLQVGPAGVDTLLNREPGVKASLDSPTAIATLLTCLHRTDPQTQFRALADRATAHVDVRDPAGTATLLDLFLHIHADEHIDALLVRDPARWASLEALPDACELLCSLRKIDTASAQEQFDALADRLAHEMPLEDPYSVAMVLLVFQDLGLDDSFQAVLDREPARSIDVLDAEGVALLLQLLLIRGDAQSRGQVDAVMALDPGNRCALDDLNDPRTVVGNLALAIGAAGGDPSPVLERARRYQYPVGLTAPILEMRENLSSFDFRTLVDNRVVQVQDDGTLSWRGHGSVSRYGRTLDEPETPASRWTWSDV